MGGATPQQLMDFLKQQERPVPQPEQSANPKADLANWCGQVGLLQPVYTSAREGPDHRPYYSTKATIKDIVIGTGMGARKTAAEVAAAAVGLQTLQIWITGLRLEGDKFMRTGSKLALSVEPDSVELLDDTDRDILLQTMMCHANAFANTGAGLLVLGAPGGSVEGARLTREDVDELLAQFDLLIKQWTPAPSPQCFAWKVWPVFSATEINDGTMFQVMDGIFGTKDPRGMVWPPDRPIVLGLFVKRSHCSMHMLPVSLLLHCPSKESQRHAYVRTRKGIRLFSEEEINRILGK